MLSDLALAVKGFWGYDQAFIESCRDELAFGPDDIARRPFVAADLGGLVAGCYSVDGDPPVGELGNMWIRPSKIGTGLGRVLWQDAMATHGRPRGRRPSPSVRPRGSTAVQWQNRTPTPRGVKPGRSRPDLAHGSDIVGLVGSGA
jgi:hypothetical protein